jgi:TonB-dependent receptor-like protein
LVNDFMFAFSRSVGPQLVVPAQYTNFPNVEIDDLGINIGPNGCSPQTTIINTYQLADSVTKVFGSHTVKFGAEIRDYISPSNFLPRARGEWDYATLQTFISDGIPDGANGDLRGAGSGFFAANFKSFYGFVQDDWKATRKLTINAGLRYEYNGVPRDEALQNLNAIANDPGLGLIFRTPKADKKDWAPRLGFAYDPTGSGKWSVRGGMGLFYDIYPVNFPQLNLPPQLQTQQVDTLTCSLPGKPLWCTDITAGFLQTGGLLQVNVPPVKRDDARGATQGLMTDIVEPKILSWSLSVQHEIAANTSVELRYIGNHAVSLPAQVRPSQASAFDPRFPGGGITPLPTYFSASAVPGVVAAPASTLATFNGFQNNPLAADKFGSIFTEIPGLAMSLYHGGSVNVIHRLGHGLYVQGDYTWAHVDDDATAELFSTRVNPRRAEDGYNLKSQWGRSALDIRNKFAMAVAYELPSVHMSNAIARGFLNGWEWITTYLAETGQPVTALSGVDSNGNGDSSGDRTILNPNGTGRTGTVVDQVCNDGGGGTTRIVTASAAACADANVVGYVAENSAARYVQAGKGAKSNVGRNTISTPGLNIWNMSLLKSITLTERWKMQFRIATYNTFNHPNPSIGLPTNNGTIDQNDNPNPLSTTYPFVTAGNLFLNSSEFNAGSRRMELGLKVIF